MDALTNKAAVAAHRGWHADGAPENSIAALEQAVAGGADRIEIDVRRLGDGTLVVHHDATLGGVPLERLTIRDLAAHPEVPTLEQWAKRAGELGAGALVEVKEGGFERELMETLRRHVPDSRMDLMSFRSDVVSKLRTLAPNRPVGLLSDVAPVVDGVQNLVSGEQLVANARSAGASFLGLNVGQTGDEVLAAADRAGMGVAVWTVDRGEDITRLLADKRVNTVISDVPKFALDLRGALHGVAEPSMGVRLLKAAAVAR